MLEIVISGKCKKDLKRAQKRGLNLDEFFKVVGMLQRQEVIPPKYRDHALMAEKKGLCDIHIRPEFMRFVTPSCY